MKFPVPNVGESREQFVARVMADERFRNGFSDVEQVAVANALIARNAMENASDVSWPIVCECRHIEPGLVSYSDLGTVLVTKETLDRMSKSFIGKPVFNEVHHDDAAPVDFKNGKADGVITDHWFNAADGWYWARFVVWDGTTKNNIQSAAYSVSCGYDVLDVKENREGKLHNNIPYAGEFTDGYYTHLSVVRNPRYEGARIVVLNSKDGGVMFKFWNFLTGKDGSKVKNEGEMQADATVPVDGQAVPLKMLIDCWKAEEAEKAKAAELAATNAAKEVTEDTVLELDGKETPVKNMIEAYRRKNEADKAKADEDEKKKLKDAEDAKNAADEKEKADKEKADKDEADKKVKAENSVHEGLKVAASRRGQPQQPNITSRREMAAEGQKRYGPK